MQHRAVIVTLVATALFGSTAALNAKAFDRSIQVSGVTVHYKVILPKDYDQGKEYPAVLAFPPGSQGPDMVLTTLVRNWLPEAEQRGYIVFVPAAPNSQLFFEGGARVFPELLDKLLSEYKIRDNKFHVAGMSNGGISAFYVAAHYPKYFWSVTGFPGYLPDATSGSLNPLSNLCINMHVGEFDSGWVAEMKGQAKQLREMGMMVKFTVEKGENHVIAALQGNGSSRLFDEIDAARHGCAK